MRILRLSCLACTLALGACGRPRHATIDAGTEARASSALPEICRGDRNLPATGIPQRRPRPRFAPPARPLALLDLTFRTEGSARRPTLRSTRLSRAELRRFRRIPSEAGAVSFASPTLDGLGPTVRVLRITLTSAHARSIRVIPFGPTATDASRAQRAITVPLDPSGDATRTIAIDVGRAWWGNWRVGAGASDASSTRIQIRVDGADDATELVGLALDDDGDAYPDEAGSALVDRGGVTRPSRYVRGGIRAIATVHVPGDARALRFHLAGTEPGLVTIAARSADGTTALGAFAATTSWVPRSIDVSAFAGREVDLVVSVDRGVAFLATPEILPVPAARPPDVLLYLVDLLPATQLGAYGNPRPRVSPTIDRLLTEGLAFTRARSTSPWTKPAAPTILTGIHPSVHGVGAHDYLARLPASVPMVQERFGAAGFRTVSVAASPLGSTLSALERGFDAAITPAAFDGAIGELGEPSAAQLHERLLAFVDEEPSRPFFAFVHSLDVHEYKRPLFRDGPDPGDRPFDRALRQQDAALGSLLAELARREREVLVVLVADHGESFGEFDRHGHGSSLYQSQLVVPLVFHLPGTLPAARVDPLVSIQDLAPTLVDLYGLPPLGDADGTSLMPFAFDGRTTPVHAQLVASREWFVLHPERPAWFAAERSDGRKAIHVADGTRWVFDLDSDPCERSPRRDDDAFGETLEDEVQRLRARADEFAARHPASASTPEDADALQRLRALGYVH